MKIYQTMHVYGPYLFIVIDWTDQSILDVSLSLVSFNNFDTKSNSQSGPCKSNVRLNFFQKMLPELFLCLGVLQGVLSYNVDRYVVIQGKKS